MPRVSVLYLRSFVISVSCLFRAYFLLPSPSPYTHTRQIKSERIVIAGFSQGGAVALNTLVRSPLPLAGAFALSGWLPLAGEASAAANPVNRASPVALFHGSADQIVATAWGQASADTLRKTHPNTEFKLYEGMGHQSNAAEMTDVAQWLLRVIP